MADLLNIDQGKPQEQIEERTPELEIEGTEELLDPEVLANMDDQQLADLKAGKKVESDAAEKPETVEAEETLEQKYEKQRKQLEEKEKFINQRNEELGRERKEKKMLLALQEENLRRSAKTETIAEGEDLHDLILTDPQRAIDVARKNSEREENNRKSIEAMKLRERAVEIEHQIKETVPDIDDIENNGIIPFLKERHNFDDAAINNFKEQKYIHAARNPEVFEALIENGKLYKENKALKAENDKLKKQNTDHQSLVTNLAKPKKTLFNTTKSGGSTSNELPDYTPTQLANMSDAEFAEVKRKTIEKLKGR